MATHSEPADITPLNTAEFPTDSTAAPFLCCECGTPTEYNPTGSCAACLSARVQFTDLLPRQTTLQFCRRCERYLQPPDTWLHCPPESRQLLQLCLRRLRRLQQLQLMDAAFVWTEPHSRRLRVKLVVRRELMDSTALVHTAVVEYVVSNQMCGDCHRTEAKDYWKAVVQLRTRSANKKTFYYLEQVILRQRVHEGATNIKPIHDGLDFMFGSEAAARKFLSFVEASVPCRVQQSKKLISHDAHNNTYNYKFTLAVEIVPLCKDTVVCLPRKLANQLGSIGQLCVVLKVTNVVTLVDPATGQCAEMQAAQYWRSPFTALCGPRQLARYSVLEIETTHHHSRPVQNHQHHQYCSTDVWLLREDQLGRDDITPLHARTHISTDRLHVGDTVLALELTTANVNDSNLDRIDADRLPDLIVVKRVYGPSATRRRKRKWKLKRLPAASTEDRRQRQQKPDEDHDEYDAFLEDLEEDTALRGNVNVYRDRGAASDSEPITGDTSDAEELPEVPLHEMLEDLNLENDVEIGDTD